jgi:hypothetical protein
MEGTRMEEVLPDIFLLAIGFLVVAAIVIFP